jgi:hypothetical protein
MPTAHEIIDVLLAWAQDKICCTEVSFSEHKSRADMITIEPVRSQSFRLTAYEVKVSRADFKRDSEAKQEAALIYSDRFFYVTPPAMVRKEEVPPWAGLIECDGTTLKVIKFAPKRRKAAPTWQLVVDIFRSATRVRRDTNLFTSEIAALRHHIKRMNDSQESVERWKRERWMNQWMQEARNKISPAHTPQTP